DLSWRWSLKSLPPSPSVNGEDLSADDKKMLGLDPKRLAFRQGVYVPQAAKNAGVQVNDVILGVNGKTLEMTMRQFDVHVRLNHRPGETIILNVLRGKERLDLKMKLPER